MLATQERSTICRNRWHVRFHKKGSKFLNLFHHKATIRHQWNRQHCQLCRTSCISSGPRKVGVLLAPLQHAPGHWSNRQHWQFHRISCVSSYPRKVGVLLAPLQHASGHRSNRPHHVFCKAERVSPCVEKIKCIVDSVAARTRPPVQQTTLSVLQVAMRVSLCPEN